MKKILFLLLICFIKLNAYQYQIYDFKGASGSKLRYIYYYDNNNNLMCNYVDADGNITNTITLKNASTIYAHLGSIKKSHSGLSSYITSEIFDSYYKNDLIFLNDLYLQVTNAFFNYLYNDKSFNAFNYINYDNYQILYNEDGLAVESIVDGVWAGLYSDSQKSKSGALYNKNGSLIYYNGKEVTPVTSFLVWFQKFTNKVVIETFEEIQRSLVAGIIAAVVLVLAIVRLVLELLPSSITPRRRRYYGGARGSLPGYGDGSQVAASVRARLAAKNRVLKARAYDRSGVEDSTVNGILFDLENDR